MGYLQLLVISSLLFGISYGASYARFSCWTDTKGDQQSTWYPEGSRIIRGRYLYDCIKGDLIAIGCIHEDGRQFLTGESYIDDSREVRYTCIDDGNDYLFFQQSACVDKYGGVHEIDDEWEDKEGLPQYYECQSEIYFGRKQCFSKVLGCYIQSREYTFGQQLFNYKGGNWECLEKVDEAVLCLKECIYNGRNVPIGQWTLSFDQRANYTCNQDTQTNLPIMLCSGEGCASPVLQLG